jgi:hypothetical protein
VLQHSLSPHDPQTLNLSSQNPKCCCDAVAWLRCCSGHDSLLFAVPQFNIRQK